MAEAIILGSGTSNGVPMLGREYPSDYLAEPKNHRTRASIVISGPTGNLLIDCAPELRIQMHREALVDLDAVLITHAHADHIMGMDDLRSLCLKYQRAMKVYASPATQEDIRRIFPYAFKEFPPGVWVPRFDLTEVPSVIHVGGLDVKTFTVMHGPTPVVGVRVNDFAYVTDVSHIPAPAWEMLQGLDTLVLDAVRIQPHPNHFHFDRAVEVATQLGAHQTYFTHLSHDYDHHKTNSTLPVAIQLAYDGLRIPIHH